MDKRLKKLIKNTKLKKDTLLDTYNQKVYESITPTITTRVNASNEIYVVVKDEKK